MIEVLSVASEAYPLIKTGGLADVTGALPAALAQHDVHVRTMLPGYPAVMQALDIDAESVELPNFFGGRARLRLRLRVAGRERGSGTERRDS